MNNTTGWIWMGSDWEIKARESMVFEYIDKIEEVRHKTAWPKFHEQAYRMLTTGAYLMQHFNLTNEEAKEYLKKHEERDKDGN